MTTTTDNSLHPVETTSTPLTDLLETLKPIVRPLMLRHFTANCCIATSRMLRDIFEHYGYRARAVPTTVEILNAAMLRLLDSGEAFPEDRDERIAFFGERGNAWGVGIQPSETMKQSAFGGHLVLSVNGLLVDGSLSQANRPEKQIELPSLLWFRPEQSFFATKPKRQLTAGMIGECGMRYRRLDDETYRTSPNWRQRHAGVPEVYAQIVTLAELALDRKRRNGQNSV
jgi:hypothetical protein